MKEQKVQPGVSQRRHGKFAASSLAFFVPEALQGAGGEEGAVRRQGFALVPISKVNSTPGMTGSDLSVQTPGVIQNRVVAEGHGNKGCSCCGVMSGLQVGVQTSGEEDGGDDPEENRGIVERLLDLKPHQAGRRAREKMRRALQDISKKKSFLWCGKMKDAHKIPVDQKGNPEITEWALSQSVEVKTHEGRAYYDGLMTCRSVFCPVCGPKKSHRSAIRLGRAIEKHHERFLDGTVLTQIFTHSHRHFHTLKEMLGSQKKAWDAFFQGRRGVKFRTRLEEVYGFKGYFNALDGTYGLKTGHHPHRHVIWLFDRELTDAEISGFEGEIFEIWAEAVEKEGWSRPYREFCGVQKLRSNAQIAQYVAKVTGLRFKQGEYALARELASPVGKTSEKKNRYSYSEVAMRAARGEEGFEALYLEIEDGYRGRQMLTMSKYGRELWDEAGEELEKEWAEEEKKRKEESESASKIPWWFFMELYLLGLTSTVPEVAERNGQGIEVLNKAIDYLWDSAPLLRNWVGKEGDLIEIKQAPPKEIRAPLVAAVMTWALRADRVGVPLELLRLQTRAPQFWRTFQNVP